MSRYGAQVHGHYPSPPPPFPFSRSSFPAVYSPADQGCLFTTAAAATVIVDFLMPNGILITLNVTTTLSLAEIKAELWDKASDYPLAWSLHDQNMYHFACITPQAEIQELMDEEKRFKDIQLFINIIRVIERKGNEAEKLLNKRISDLIGKSLVDFEALKNPEVNEFRWKVKAVCDDVVKTRNNQSWRKQVQYKYPCSLDLSSEIPLYLQKKLTENEGQILVSIKFSHSLRLPQSVESMFTFRVKPDILPSELMELALNKFNTREAQVMASKENCIFKILGREEYLVCEEPLFKYLSIQEHLSQVDKSAVKLIVVARKDVDVEVDPCYMELSCVDSSTSSVRSSFSSMTLNKKKSINFESSWTVEHPFKVRIGTIAKLNVDDQVEVFLCAGLYHASQSLCETRCTKQLEVQDGKAEVDQELEFSIAVCNIPRSARLSIAIYEMSKALNKTKGKAVSASTRQENNSNPLAWVNTSVFDYKRQLRGGAMTLYAWNMYEEQQMSDLDLPNPLGTVVSNPDHDRAISLTITFTKYHPTCTLMYPSHDFLLAESNKYPLDEDLQPSDADKHLLEEIASRDPLTELHEQDRKKVWNLRAYCARHVPHILPKLLQCVEWDNKIEVAQMLGVLEKWPKLKPEAALELLDYAYAEPTVRSYAVDCLFSLSDDDLLLYLLQLTQALKHENYLYCNLMEFLLHKALTNMRVGHFLFWHLRSEMHVSSVSIRFGLILEAYCRGSIEHMRLLQRQLDALQKFKELQKSLREKPLSKERVRAALHEMLKKSQVQNSLSEFCNPLDPVYSINRIKVEKCRSMDSKMAPLWLVFENNDSEGSDISLLYKRGDDLRQDMLTLQMIRIMDKLWKRHGLDFRMTAYCCMSTDLREGLIEGVRDAATIANIQREKGLVAATSAFRKGSLLEWLKEKNASETLLTKAIREFTLSCAGYCVATYVLGIADRHSDNIMVMENGQMFHIDFGHILGRFKEKFGVKREHQPFVLTHDFVNVITRGSTKQSEEFIVFREYCEMAFMLLRRYGSFIISLFAMMISTGLPELQGENDLHYIKDKLKLDLPDDEAKAHFRSKFAEALSNSWKTSFNWAFHAMSKDNR